MSFYGRIKLTTDNQMAEAFYKKAFLQKDILKICCKFSENTHAQVWY